LTIKPPQENSSGHCGVAPEHHEEASLSASFRMAYPTPPPTDSNSPSHTHTTYKVPSYFAASQNPLQYSSYTSSAYQPQTQTPRHTQSYGPPATASAQDSYFHSYSAPNSPLVPPSQPYSVPAFPPKPERRQTSPIQSVSRPYSPLRASRTSSPPRRRSPGNPNCMPNHFFKMYQRDQILISNNRLQYITSSPDRIS